MFYNSPNRGLLHRTVRKITKIYPQLLYKLPKRNQDITLQSPKRKEIRELTNYTETII